MESKKPGARTTQRNFETCILGDDDTYCQRRRKMMMKRKSIAYSKED
jgi:hypothetical protein